MIVMMMMVRNKTLPVPQQKRFLSWKLVWLRKEVARVGSGLSSCLVEESWAS